MWALDVFTRDAIRRDTGGRRPGQAAAVATARRAVAGGGLPPLVAVRDRDGGRRAARERARRRARVLDYRRLEARHTEAEAELAAIRAQNEALRRRTRQLKSDPVAIEQEIRDQLGYVRTGEVLFTIRDAPVTTGKPAPPR